MGPGFFGSFFSWQILQSPLANGAWVHFTEEPFSSGFVEKIFFKTTLSLTALFLFPLVLRMLAFFEIPLVPVSVVFGKAFATIAIPNKETAKTIMDLAVMYSFLRVLCLSLTQKYKPDKVSHCRISQMSMEVECGEMSFGAL
jgi:hypothetical protein